MFRKDPKRIGEILPNILPFPAVQRYMHRSKILEMWDSIINPPLNKHIQPGELQGKKLILLVDSPVLRAELEFRKKQLIKQINHHLGDAVVEEIEIRFHSRTMHGQ